jgi:glutathione S-transferase
METTMKLYFAPFACSLAPRIALEEAGLAYSDEKVDLRAKTTATGRNYREVNPKGYVPALEVGPDQVLTECAAILGYLADQAPEGALAPLHGTFERARLQEWLTFISSELHKSVGALFLRPEADARAALVERINQRLAYVEAHLSGNWLVDDRFSVADAYLFTVLNWAGWVQLDLSAHSAIVAFMDRVKNRPAVQSAMGKDAAAQA